MLPVRGVKNLYWQEVNTGLKLVLGTKTSPDPRARARLEAGLRSAGSRALGDPYGAFLRMAGAAFCSPASPCPAAGIPLGFLALPSPAFALGSSGCAPLGAFPSLFPTGALRSPLAPAPAALLPSPSPASSAAGATRFPRRRLPGAWGWPAAGRGFAPAPAGFAAAGSRAWRKESSTSGCRHATAPGPAAGPTHVHRLRPRLRLRCCRLLLRSTCGRGDA